MITRALAAATVVVLLGSLAACAPEPDTTPTSPAAATPTSSATPSAPTTRFDLDCDTIATADTISALVDATVQKRDPLVAYAVDSSMIPVVAPLEMVGGLACMWSEGTTLFSNDLSLGAAVSILPEATAEYVASQEVNPSNPELECGKPSGTCYVSELIGDYWVRVVVLYRDSGSLPTNASTPEMTEFVTSIETLVSALEAPSPRWVPSVGTVALTTGCDTFFAAIQAQTALDLDVVPTEGEPGTPGDIFGAAMNQSGGAYCPFMYVDEPDFGYHVSWLPAGKWAAEQVLPLATIPTSVSPVSLSSLASGDEAYIRCNDGATTCVVDLVVGGNWVQIDGQSSSDSRERTLTLAGAIAAKIYS